MAENPREGSLETLLLQRRVIPHGWLQVLQILEQRLATRPRQALLRLQCQGGQTLEGNLVRYHASEGTLLLSHQGNLSWVELSCLQALTLLDCDSWLSDLSQARTETQPAPSRLQLRREAEQLGQRLAPAQLQLAWDQVPDDEQSARHLGQFLKDLGSCWERLGADEMGAQALHSVRLVQLEITTAPGTTTLDGGLCRVRLTRGPDGLLAYPYAQLLNELEKQL